MEKLHISVAYVTSQLSLNKEDFIGIVGMYFIHTPQHYIEEALRLFNAGSIEDIWNKRHK